jgi:glycine cleavage system aminomethyltransferase T
MSLTTEQPELLSSPIAARTAREGQEIEDIYGMAQPIFIDDPLLEYKAVREGVGLLDFSPLLKVDIEGPDAKGKLSRLHTRDLGKVPTGRIAYGAILNDRGCIVDDSTVMVRGEDRLRMAGSPLMPGQVIPFATEQGLSAVERRAELAHLNVQGPRSRELLAALTPTDVSNEAFPYYTFRESMTVAGVDVFVTRMGFTAELGYELFVPVESALAVYDALMEAGAEWGMRPVGVAAVMMIRLEAGMVMGEFEYDENTSPWEASLGWAVDLDKGEFRGRDAAIRLRDERPGRITSVVLEGGEDAATGAELRRDGEPVGHVTMSMPSPYLGKTLGLARVDPQKAPAGTAVVALVEGEEIPGEVVPAPVYDPERKRVRS